MLESTQLSRGQDRRIAGHQGVAAGKLELWIAIGVGPAGHSGKARISKNALPATIDSLVGVGQVADRDVCCPAVDVAIGPFPVELAEGVRVSGWAAGIGGVAPVGGLAVDLAKASRGRRVPDALREVVDAGVLHGQNAAGQQGAAGEHLLGRAHGVDDTLPHRLTPIARSAGPAVPKGHLDVAIWLVGGVLARQGALGLHHQQAHLRIHIVRPAHGHTGPARVGEPAAHLSAEYLQLIGGNEN